MNPEDLSQFLDKTISACRDQAKAKNLNEEETQKLLMDTLSQFYKIIEGYAYEKAIQTTRDLFVEKCPEFGSYFEELDQSKESEELKKKTQPTPTKHRLPRMTEHTDPTDPFEESRKRQLGQTIRPTLEQTTIPRKRRSNNTHRQYFDFDAEDFKTKSPEEEQPSNRRIEEQRTNSSRRQQEDVGDPCSRPMRSHC